MNTQTENNTTDTAEKMPYNTPALTDYGTIEELTQFGGGANADGDGGSQT